MEFDLDQKIPLNINWKRLLFLTVILLAIVFFLRLFIFVLTPFFLAFLIAVLVDRPVNFLAQYIPRFISVLFTLSLVLVILSILIIFIFSSIIYELIYLSSFLPQYREQIIHYINRSLEFYQEFFEPMPVEVLNIIDQNLIQRGEAIISNTISNIIEGTVSFTVNIPGLFLFIIFMIIASFFISKDKERIAAYLSSKTNISQNLQSSILHDVFSYLRVQFLIMTNTTILTGTTFYLLNFHYAILLALSCGVLDLIPVVGPGGILLPLIIYYFIFDIKIALIFLILYLIISGARPILESKILGNKVGLHPLVLLLGLYVGLTFLGVEGLILAPLSIIILKVMLNNGLIQ